MYQYVMDAVIERRTQNKIVVYSENRLLTQATSQHLTRSECGLFVMTRDMSMNGENR